MIGDIHLLKNTNLLYLEDYPTIQMEHKHIFQKFFNEVHCGENGKDGLAILEENSVDVIITDIEMPKLNGIEFAKIVKEDSSIPIIFMSAHTQIDYLLQAVKIGTLDYLIKPVKHSALKEALEKVADYLSEHNRFEIEINKDIHYNPANRVLYSNKEEVVLPNKEAALLELLLNNKERIVEKYTIEDVVYDGEYMSNVALKSLVSKIRKKIPKDYIKTVRENGYMFKTS
ncbi:MAG: response regulator transcription factor [Campylobacterales bacterium]